MDINYKQRLLQVIKEQGFNVHEFEKRLGTGRNSIRRVVSSVDNEVGNITMPILYKILELIPDLSMEWLIKGEGEMYKRMEIRNSTNIIGDHNTNVNNNIINDNRGECPSCKDKDKMIAILESYIKVLEQNKPQ